MRSIGLLAGVTASLVLVFACSGGNDVTTPPENAAPVASFTMPSCTINIPCDFVSTSTDDGAVTEWSWDFDGDGTADKNTANASFTYQTAGNFNVSLTVHDAQGLSNTKAGTITIAPVPPGNPAPTASFTHTCDGPVCSFVSTSTDVAPGTIAAYSWSFGDGATDQTASPAHSYSITAPTDFTVTLTVTDNEGATAVETQTVSVNPAGSGNTPPTAGFTHSCNVAVCTFVSTSSDAAPGSIASYAWTFGDNGTANVASPSHTYSIAAAADFAVTLTVTDNEGASDTETQTIHVDPVAPLNPPVARFSYSCAAAVCSFVSTSYDHFGSIAATAWTFGDGGTSTEASPSHTYAVTSAAQFTVTLTVTDNQGNTNVTSSQISIDPSAPNQPPVAGFRPWCYGESCIFFSTSTDAKPGAIVTYAWTFGDGATDDWNAPNHVYSIAGKTTFPVTLTVTDNEGATSTSTQNVTVSPLPVRAQGCYTSGKIVDCLLDIPNRSTLKLTLLGLNCDLNTKPASSITTPPPVGDQIFLTLCILPVGSQLGIFGGRLDELWVYQAGSQAHIWFTQGVPKAGQSLAAPAGRVTGTWPDWTLNFEDGAHADDPAEASDFSDVVVGVHATAK